MILMTPNQRHDIVRHLVDSGDRSLFPNSEIANVSGTSEAYVNRVAAGADCSQVVYAIRCGRFVKYGISTDVMSRLAAIATASPYSVWLARTWEISHSLEEFESSLHKSLNRDHHRGEWFVYREDHFDSIEEMAEVHNAMFTEDDWVETRSRTIKHVMLFHVQKMREAVQRYSQLLPSPEKLKIVLDNLAAAENAIRTWESNE